MGEYLKKIGLQIKNFLAGLTPAKKLALVVTSIIVVVGVAFLFRWAGTESYLTLMRDLNPEDSANVIRVLREKRIPFKVDPTGRNIEVPPEALYDLRFELATLGMPQSGVVGYEIFDSQSLGTTSFVQKINQQRALEGELIRTIGTIRGVKRSRVHLAIPKKSTFVEDQKEPTASVVLDLDPGVRLSEKQIYGIGNLVARAVEGLEVESVVIVDSEGRTLSKNTHDALVIRSASQLEFQRKLEEDLEKRIEGILSPIVGEGKVVARVASELEFAHTTETQTLYDSEGSAVRSVEKQDENAKATRPGAYGAPGAATNTPGATNTANQINSNTAKIRETTNYEIPKTVRQIQKPMGTINKLSVAVVVDGKAVKEKDADGKVLSKVKPWTPEQLQEFEAIVTNAAGVDKKRGDSLNIKNMEFSQTDFEDSEKILADTQRKNYIMNLVIYAVISLVIILFFLFVVRPFIKWVTENTIDSVDTFLPQTIEELEKLQKNQNLMNLEEAVPDLPEKIDPEKVEGEMIKEKIITLVDANPHKAALILRDWLRVEKKNEKEGAQKGA